MVHPPLPYYAVTAKMFSAHFFCRQLLIHHPDPLFPASTSGSGPGLPTSTDSPEAVATLRNWLGKCLATHPECRPQFKPWASEALPTRLIDVGLPEEPFIPRLVEIWRIHAWEERLYFTLSHCWGDMDIDAKLTRENYAAFVKDGIPVRSLRKTLRDALHITRQLGCRYIWIDSLCIIQDSPEDWAIEAMAMKDVYGNSSCNIAALGNPGDGCFVTRNPLNFFPCWIGGGMEPNSEGSVYAFKHYNPSLDSREDHQGGSPLLRRGWVVQEKLLSTRVIYMGAPQLYWECARHTLSEGVPVTEESAPIIPFYNQLVCSKPDFRALHGQTRNSVSHVLQHEAQDMIDLCKCWMNMVSGYCKMEFSRKEDRLIAFAGVAKAIADGRGWTYVAGTWREFWPFDLLWARYEPDPRPIDLHWREDIFQPVIPSWSWAYKSIDSATKANPAVHFLSSRYQQLFDPVTQRLTISYLATVVYFSCPNFRTQHSLDGVKKGYIKIVLKGKVLRGKLKTFNDTSGVQVHWDVKVPSQNELLFLLLMRWTESSDEQQAGLVLVKQKAPGSLLRYQPMYLRIGVWEDYSPQLRHGRRLLFSDSVAEEVVHLC